MRDYAKVSPSFWTGETGKDLRRRGIEGAYVGVYLMTAPGSNMLGLYYQPLLYMAHETGLGIEGATKGLRWAIECGFCRHDETTEFVWVCEMARYQIGDSLKSEDKRCVGIQRDYDALPHNPFLGAFFDRYALDFHLTKRRNSEADLEAPSKPLRCKEQEQEQEIEKKDRPVGLSKEEGIANGHDLLGDATKRRSKRCPTDFVVTAIMRAEIAADCPGVDIDFETKAFRDHDFKVARIDWHAAWRNWLREAFKRLPPSAKPEKYRGKTL